MINWIEVEFFKFKRKRLALSIFIFLILYFLGMTFWCFNIPRNDPQMDSVLDFYNRYSVYMTMILPILIGTIFIKAYSEEYRNNVLKELYQIPISMNGMFVVKSIFTTVIALIISIINCFLTQIGVLVCKFPDSNLENIIGNVKMYIVIGGLIPIAMFPIFLLAVLMKDNITLTCTINVLYVILGSIGVNHLAGIHPLSSLLNIIFNKQIASGNHNVTKFMCVGNLFLVGIVCCIAVLLINKYRENQ